MGQEFRLATGQSGKGPPTEDTDGCEGATYMDTDTKKMYKCVQCDNGKYTWAPLLGDEDATIGGKRLLDWVYPPGFYCICDNKNLPADHFGGRWEHTEVSGNKYYWKRLPDYDAYILFVGEGGALYIEGEGVMPEFFFDVDTGDLYTDSTQNLEYDEETGNLYVIDLERDLGE